MDVIFKNAIFKLVLFAGLFRSSQENALRWMPQGITFDQVNICSGNGLVLAGNKPLPEPMLTLIYVAMWSH